MSHSDDTETGGKGDRTEHEEQDTVDLPGRAGRTSGILGRRTALKAGATALAASVGMGAASAQEEDYDTIKVPRGSIRHITVGSGETLRNKLFDVSAPGAGVKIVPSGSGWVVENIGFKGRFNAETFAVNPHVNKGSRGVIRNVYAKGYGTKGGGVWVQPSHAGELVIENVWLEGFPNNGVYGSAPGKRRGTGMGRVVIRDSVGCNNNVAQFRTGSPNCVVENCAMWLDKIPEDYPLTNAGVTARGVWVRGYDCTVRNCDIQIPTKFDEAGAAILAVESSTQFPGSDRTYADLENTRLQGFTKGDIVGSSAGAPEKRVPAGVPRTPEEAASGGGAGTGNSGSSSTSSSLENSLRIDTEDGADLVSYQVLTSGEIRRDAGAETNDTITHNIDDTWMVEGVVGNGYADTFEFEGEVLDVILDNPATVYVNGTELDPATLDAHTLKIDTEDGADLVEYEVVTSGEVAPGSDAEDNDRIVQNDDGTWTASGVVGNGYADSFTFEGEVQDVTLSNPATVLVDGEELDPATLDAGSTWHDLQVAGTGDRTIYAFQVSGELEAGDTVDDHENVGADSVSGVVSDDVDAYRFTGELVDVAVYGDAEVTVDGEPVDTDSL